MLLVVSAGKDGALTGGDAFMKAVGDDLIDSIVGENISILTGELSGAELGPQPEIWHFGCGVQHCLWVFGFGGPPPLPWVLVPTASPTPMPACLLTLPPLP